MPQLPNIKPQWQVTSWSQLKRSPLNTGSGRSVVSLVEHPLGLLVERPYRHGGLRRLFFADAFVKGPRAANEFFIHHAAFVGGVATPEPIGWRERPLAIPFFCRYFFYSLYLDNAILLPNWLEKNGLSTNLAQQMAHIIYRLHELGIKHADLNLNNWLVSGGKMYLIDFDKGTQTHQDPVVYLTAVLRRMVRSSRKLGVTPTLPFFRFVIKTAALFKLPPRDLIGLLPAASHKRRFYHRFLWRLSGGHYR